MYSPLQLDIRTHPGNADVRGVLSGEQRGNDQASDFVVSQVCAIVVLGFNQSLQKVLTFPRFT